MLDIGLQKTGEKNWKYWGHDFKFTKYTINTRWGLATVISN